MSGKPGRPRSTSLPYIPIDPHQEEHERIDSFVDLAAPHTSIPDGFISEIPTKIWRYAGRRRVDGNLGAMSPRLLAKICHWDGEPEKLLAALLDSGLLERDDAGDLKIHDWDDYGGEVLANRERWRQRNRNRNARKTGELGINTELTPSEPRVNHEFSPPEGEGEGEGEGEDITPPLPPQGGPNNSAVQQVVDHYRNTHPRRGRHLKPGHKDWKRVERLLSDGFEVPDLLLCIDGNARCEWHSERSLHGFDYVFRNPGKVEQFIALAQPRQSSALRRVERLAMEGPTATRHHAQLAGPEFIFTPPPRDDDGDEVVQ